VDESRGKVGESRRESSRRERGLACISDRREKSFASPGVLGLQRSRSLISSPAGGFRACQAEKVWRGVGAKNLSRTAGAVMRPGYTFPNSSRQAEGFFGDRAESAVQGLRHQVKDVYGSARGRGGGVMGV